MSCFGKTRPGSRSLLLHGVNYFVAGLVHLFGAELAHFAAVLAAFCVGGVLSEHAVGLSKFFGLSGGGRGELRLSSRG
jgi:hypothetical protein